MTRKIWAGLDVGVETTSLCVINETGEILQEARCQTALDTIDREIRWLRRRRSAIVSLEAGSGFTLARGLRNRGYSVNIYETRQLSKFLRARRNKTDAGDAAGIAEAGRLGATLISKVHLKSLECESLQSRLAIRRHLIRQRVSAANLLCRQLEQFGCRVSRSTKSKQFCEIAEAAIKKAFGKAPNAVAFELRKLLNYCEQLIAYQYDADRELARLARENEICRRFMEIPGVGPICVLTFYAAVGDPHRFRRSTDVGCYIGLTPRLHQSGLTVRVGRISRMGNSAARSLLVHSSVHFMKSSHPQSKLRVWASRIEQTRGRGQARVALARKLAVVMLAMWKKGERYEEHILV